MTGHSVKRLMLGATIAAATALTALAIAGLVVTSRGPQAQELPLVRTSVGQVAILDPSGGGDYKDSGADHPPVSQPPVRQGGDQTPPAAPVAQTTTTATAVAALGGAATVSSGTTARKTSGSLSTEQAGTTTPSLTPISVTPTHIVTLSSSPTPPTTDSRDDGASGVYWEQAKKSESDEDNTDGEIVSPKIREGVDQNPLVAPVMQSTTTTAAVSTLRGEDTVSSGIRASDDTHDD